MKIINFMIVQINATLVNIYLCYLKQIWSGSMLMIKIIIFSFLLIDAKKRFESHRPGFIFDLDYSSQNIFFAKHMLIQNCLIVWILRDTVFNKHPFC